MPPQRLPIVNGDDGTWGDILRQYLLKEHYDDGTDNADNGGHKTVTLQPGTAAAGTAPLKFASGTLLSSPETGAVEFNTDDLYFTVTSGTTRKKVALYDDSAGATGDIYYRNGSGYLVRLGIGSEGQALTVASGLPAWEDAASPTFATSTKTTSYTITATDTVIFADATSGSVTITLPVASSLPGYRFYVKRIDDSANDVTVERSSSDTIDGETSHTLDVQYMSVTIVSNGNDWFIL